jgi:hypothetical protein
MPSAIDVFREQREAAEQLHGRLQEIAALLAALRSRVGFADFVEHRVLTMTPAERRQFEALMTWKPPRP